MSRRINKQCPKPSCGQKKFNERELFSHYRKFHMINELACAECFAEFAQVSELSNHFAKLHPSLNEFRYIAEGVKNEGTNYRGYEILQKQNVPIEKNYTPSDDRIKCSLCPKHQSFETTTKLHWHCFLSHAEDFVTCARCEMPFSSLALLKDHYPDYCCPKSSDNATVEHMIAFVSDKQCLVCNIVCAGKSEALQHCMRMHLKIRYLCDICRLHFSSNDGLKEHRAYMHQSRTTIKFERIPTRKHTEINPVISPLDSRKIISKFNEKMCIICNKNFQTISDIRDHFQLVHQTKIYVCEMCDPQHGYIHERSMKSHQEQYFGEMECMNDSPPDVSVNSTVNEVQAKATAKSSLSLIETNTPLKRCIRSPRRYDACTSYESRKKMRLQTPQPATSSASSAVPNHIQNPTQAMPTPFKIEAVSKRCTKKPVPNNIARTWKKMPKQVIKFNAVAQKTSSTAAKSTDTNQIHKNSSQDSKYGHSSKQASPIKPIPLKHNAVQFDTVATASKIGSKLPPANKARSSNKSPKTPGQRHVFKFIERKHSKSRSQTPQQAKLAAPSAVSNHKSSSTKVLCETTESVKAKAASKRRSDAVPNEKHELHSLHSISSTSQDLQEKRKKAKKVARHPFLPHDKWSTRNNTVLSGAPSHKLSAPESYEKRIKMTEQMKASGIGTKNFDKNNVQTNSATAPKLFLTNLKMIDAEAVPIDTETSPIKLPDMPILIENEILPFTLTKSSTPTRPCPMNGNHAKMQQQSQKIPLPVDVNKIQKNSSDVQSSKPVLLARSVNTAEASPGIGSKQAISSKITETRGRIGGMKSAVEMYENRKRMRGCEISAQARLSEIVDKLNNRNIADASNSVWKSPAAEYPVTAQKRWSTKTETFEAEAVPIDTGTSPIKLPDMPMLLQNETLRLISNKSPIPINTRAANEHREKMPQNAPLDISSSETNGIHENAISSVSTITHHSSEQFPQQNVEFLAHDQTYENIQYQFVIEEIANEPAMEQIASTEDSVAMNSKTSHELSSAGILEEQKADEESGNASATAHIRPAPDPSNVEIKMECDSDSDVEYVGQYTLGAPDPPTPPLPPASEYHDLTRGSDDEWDLFMTVYKPGDLDVDVKPIIKTENLKL